MDEFQLCEICGEEMTDEKEIYECGEYHFACNWKSFDDYRHDVELYMYEDYGIRSHEYDSGYSASGWSNRLHPRTVCEEIYRDLGKDDDD